jgi:hypothetical protein
MIDEFLIKEMAITEASRRFGLISDHLKDFYDIKDIYYEVIDEIHASLADDLGDSSPNINDPENWSY